MARLNSDNWTTPLLIIGGLLLADKVLGLFSDPNDPGERPYPDPGGRPAQWGESQYRAYADSIEAAVWGWWDVTEDESTVVDILRRIPTDRDAVNLVNIYGLRGGVFGMEQMTLPATVRAYLSDSDIATINSALAQRGVKFRF